MKTFYISIFICLNNVVLVLVGFYYKVSNKRLAKTKKGEDPDGLE